MILPPDGELPAITSSNLNLFNDIIIVKVDDKWKKPGEPTYQLASLDISKKGNVWPADSFVSKLFPDLSKNKAKKKYNKQLDIKKEMDMVTNKKNNSRSRPFRRLARNNYRSIGMRRPNLARKRNWSDRTEAHNRPKLKKDIEPWVQKPWESYLPEGASSVNMHPPIVPYTQPYDNFSTNMQTKGLLGNCPPSEFGHGHSLLGPHPSANNNLESHYSNFDKDNPSCNSFNRTEPYVGDPSKHNYNNYSLQPGGGHSSNNYATHNARPVMQAFGSYNNYMDPERKDFSTNYMYDDNNYSEFCREESSAKVDTYKKFGQMQHNAPCTAQKPYAPNSRHGPPCMPPFEDNYIEPTKDVSFDNHTEIPLNEVFKEAPYRKQFPPMKNNTEKWGAFPTDFNNGSTSRENRSLGPRPNMNSWRRNNQKFNRRKGFRNRGNQR